MRSLEKVWWDCFRDSQEERLIDAVRAYTRKGRFFPTPADIREQYDILTNQAVAKIKSLPMPDKLSDEQAELNRRGVERLRKKLGWNRKMPQQVKPDPEHGKRVKEQARAILRKSA